MKNRTRETVHRTLSNFFFSLDSPPSPFRFSFLSFIPAAGFVFFYKQTSSSVTDSRRRTQYTHTHTHTHTHTNKQSDDRWRLLHGGGSRSVRPGHGGAMLADRRAQPTPLRCSTILLMYTSVKIIMAVVIFIWGLPGPCRLLNGGGPPTPLEPFLLLSYTIYSSHRS